MALSEKEELELLELEEAEYQHSKSKDSIEAPKMGLLDAAKAGYVESIPFSDRIGAFAGALGAKSFEGGDERSFSDVYNEILPQVREQQKADITQAREDQPITAYGSQAIGSLAIPLPGGSAASGAATIGKLGLKEGLKAAAKEGLKQAPKFGLLGGVLGASGSEDLTNIPETALNVGVGALTGAALSPIASAGTELLGRGIKGALPTLGKGLKIVKEAIPEFLTAPVDTAILNTKPGVSTVTKTGRERLIKDFAKTIEKPVEEVVAFNKNKINQLTDNINSVSKNIQTLTDKGAAKEADALLNAQIEEMQSVLNQIDEVGQAAGKAVGEPFELAAADKKTTGALLEGVKKLKTLIESNTNLSRSQEALDLLAQLEGRVKAPDIKVKLTQKQALNAEGDLEKEINTLAASGKYSPEELAAIKAQAKAQMGETVQQGKISESAVTGPEGEALSSASAKTAEYVIPGQEIAQADVPTYRGFLEDIRDTLNKGNLKPTLKRAVTDIKQSIEQQGRKELLGEAGAQANAQAAKKYSVYKNILESMGAESEEQLSSKMTKELSVIAQDPSNVQNLARKNQLISMFSELDPILARSIEERLATLQAKQAAIPKSTPSEKLSNIFENTLPKKELQTAAEKQGVAEAFDPLKRYVGETFADDLIKQGEGLGTEVQSRRKIVEGLKDLGQVLSNVQKQGPEKLDVQAKLDSLVQNLKEAKGSEVADQFIKDNEAKFKAFKLATKTGGNFLSSTYYAIANAFAGVLGQVAKPLVRVGEKLGTITKAAGTTAKATIPSRFKKLQEWSSQLEAKGLSGIPDIAQEAATSDITKKAALIFNASQNSSKFRNLMEEEE